MKPLWSDVSNELSTYWRESADPLTSLLFVGPLLIAYEITLLQQTLPRSAPENWASDLLGRGEIGWITLPVATVILLLVLHKTSQLPWRLRWDLLLAMYLEAILGGIVLVAVLQLMTGVLGWIAFDIEPTLTIASESPTHYGLASYASAFAQGLSLIGSGVYEELFFRATLIPPIAWLLHRLGETKRMGLFAAAIVSSLLFALAHHQAFAARGEDFQWFTFAFRFIAGGLFTTLYVFRGFGIAAGAHVAYDFLVTSLGTT